MPDQIPVERLSYIEEHKLVRYYGEVYRRYRRQVPGLIPLPWRRLTEDQARELMDLDARPD